MIANEYVPEVVRSAGVRTTLALDVRPAVARGDEAIVEILRALAALGDDEALHLIAPFEPLALYEVVSRQGRRAYTERECNTFHVWLYPSRAF